MDLGLSLLAVTSLRTNPSLQHTGLPVISDRNKSPTSLEIKNKLFPLYQRAKKIYKHCVDKNIWTM